MNDLIGLKRAYGAKPGDGSGCVDCCLLALEVHKRLGYYDYTPEIAWIFEKYTDETWPRRIIPRWLLQNSTRLTGPEAHAVVLLPGATGGAMGTVMDDGTVLYISEALGVIRAPLPNMIGHYFRLNK